MTHERSRGRQRGAGRQAKPAGEPSAKKPPSAKRTSSRQLAKAASSKKGRASAPTTTPGWEEAIKSADLTLLLPGGVPMPFRLVPATTGRGFLMGEERGEQTWAEPRHWVRITRPFYLGVFPVTQAQYQALAEHAKELRLDATPSHFKSRDREDPEDVPSLRPVESVTWDDASAWCSWLQEHQAGPSLSWAPSRNGKPPFERIGLPTEAQWEYACRAGSDSEYSAGDGEGALEKVGWYGRNSRSSTRAVGRKAANGFGLYDMHGNVWEWCLDAWDALAYRAEGRLDGVADPEVVGEAGAVRVVRGGSWYDSAGDCRSALRNWGWPSDRSGSRGFRVCLVPGP